MRAIRDLVLMLLVAIWASVYIPTRSILIGFRRATAFRATYVLGPLVILLLATLFFADWIAAGIASKVLGNVRIPEGREMPLTRGMRSYSSADIQVIGGKGQGLSCSVPWYIKPFVFRGDGPVDLDMRQACVSHDFCYRHGAATYGYSQADCDFQLQEDAYRICQLLDNRPFDCQSRARIVALGVILGGANSFNKTREESTPLHETAPDTKKCKGYDDCISTYFEYDPYPERSLGSTVYRLADAPSKMAEKSFPHGQKAIYRISFHQRTMKVQIGVPGQPSLVEPFEIGGSHLYLETTPLVIQVANSGSGEDWFIWFQRESLSNTQARIAGLSVSRATVEDWRCVLQAQISTEDKLPVCAAGNSAVIIANFGSTKDTRFRSNTNDIIPVPGPARSAYLHLMTLQTHSCVGGFFRPCVRDIKLDSLAMALAPHKVSRPLSLHDYPHNYENKTGENARYRNYALMPITLTPDPLKESVFLWSRREAGNYENDLTLRSATKVVKDGAATSQPYWGAQKAKDERKTLLALGEAQEPFFVVARTTDHPLVMSIYDPDPDAHSDMTETLSWPIFQTEKDITGKSNCELSLEDRWLDRPPVVVNMGGKTTLVANKVTPTGKRWSLEVMVVSVDPSGACTDKHIERFEDFAPNSLAMSKQPLLVDDIDADGALDVLLPDDQKGKFVPELLCVINAENVCTRS